MGTKITTITKEYDSQGRVVKETITETEIPGVNKGSWEPVTPWRPHPPYYEPTIIWSTQL